MRPSITMALLVVLTTVSSDLSAQFRLATESEPLGWSPPTVRLGQERSQSVPTDLGGEAPRRDLLPAPQQPSAVPSLMGAMLAAAGGSVLGGFAGAYLGIAASNGRGDIYSGVLAGAFIGSVTGSALGAGLVTKRGGRAFLGSLAGSVLAIGMLQTSNSDSGLMLYLLIHGVVTGLVAGL